MVNELARLTCVAPVLIGQSVSAIDQGAKGLDPERRAKAIMALLGVVLAGLALVAFAVLLGRHFLRVARKPVQPTPPYQDDWFRKPLAPREPTTPKANEPE